MKYIEVILWAILAMSAGLYWWIGKVYILRPKYDRLADSWNPIRAKVALLMPMFEGIPSAARILLLMPLLGMLSVIIGGFLLTDCGWWFLGAVVILDIVFSQISVEKE